MSSAAKGPFTLHSTCFKKWKITRFVLLCKQSLLVKARSATARRVPSLSTIAQYLFGFACRSLSILSLPRDYFEVEHRGEANDITSTQGPQPSSKSLSYALDFELRLGFCVAVLGVLKLLPDGLLTLGPPCGSFVFLNAATSGRSRSNPYGFPKPYVETASLRLVCIDQLVWIDHLLLTLLPKNTPTEDMLPSNSFDGAGNSQGLLRGIRTTSFINNGLLS